MKRFILAGAPGSGKTSVLRALADMGHAVVDEAATDVIAASQAQGIGEPWDDAAFIDDVVQLQIRRRHQRPPAGAAVQFHDRSPVCTLALARYLGYPCSALLMEEVALIISESVFDRRVFLIRPIGFCEPTAARQISYADSLAFERVHEDAYRRLGFELVDIPAGTVAERAVFIDAHVRHRDLGRPRPSRSGRTFQRFGKSSSELRALDER